MTPEYRGSFTGWCSTILRQLRISTHISSREKSRRKMRNGMRLASGYSVYDTLSHARDKAKRYPWKSQCFIVELHIPDDSPFVIEQTGPRGKHYTIWGDGQLLRTMVVRILPVRGDGKNV